MFVLPIAYFGGSEENGLMRDRRGHDTIYHSSGEGSCRLEMRMEK